MKIENIPISNLTLLENNPRRISKSQMEKLCKSIKEDPDFLQKRPVLVNCVTVKDNEDGQIFHVYAGNQRVRAAKKLRIKEIPCIVDYELPEELVRKRAILDNKTFGEFDYDMLANEWEIDLLLECGFKLEELVGSLDDDEEETKESSSKTKEKTCPHCGGEL